MARNKEKAQSMLHRFREVQAAELGLGSARRSERRPRLASSVSSLRDCEKWRGEVLRDISRKVSKIQDFGLTDFEVRDLNDEINKLIREKGHWENQILALGGANYKRGVPKMLDDSGREVPGTRGYKYFGRAKDLPGVKELLTRSAAHEDELESYRSQKYRRFANQPPAYFGDADEDDDVLLRYEAEAEAQEWAEGWRELLLELAEEGEGKEGTGDGEPPPLPLREATKSLKQIREERSRPPPNAPKGPKGSGSAAAATADSAHAGGAEKRKAASARTRGGKKKRRGAGGAGGDAHGGSEGEQEEEGGEEDEGEKDGEGTSEAKQQDETMQTAEAEQTAGAVAADEVPPPTLTGGDEDDEVSRYYASVLNVLEPAELRPPSVPDKQQTEHFLLEARKAALRRQYIG